MFTILFNNVLLAQNELIIDTVYTSVDRRFLSIDAFSISNDESCVIFQSDSIYRFSNLDGLYGVNASFGIGAQNVIFRKNNKLFLLNDSIRLYPPGGVYIGDEEINRQNGLHFYNENIVFENRDGIMKVSIRSNKINKIFERTFFKINRFNTQIWFRDYKNDIYFYNPNSESVEFIINEANGIPSFDNDSLIVIYNYNEMEDIITTVIDMDLNIIIDSNSGCKRCMISSNLMAVKCKDGIRLIRGKNDVTLMSNLSDISNTTNPEIFIGYNKKGLKYFLDRYGNKIGDLSYNDIIFTTYRNWFFAKVDKTGFLYSDSMNTLLKGDFDNIKPLYENRFSVVKDKMIAVVDSNHNFILPYVPNSDGPKYISVGTINEPLFFSRREDKYIIVYDINGNKILEWTIDKNQTYIDENTIHWSYSLDALRDMSPDQAMKIRANDVYRISRQLDEQKEYRLIDRTGKELTKWYRCIYRTLTPNTYVIYTDSKKYGAIKLPPDR